MVFWIEMLDVWLTGGVARGITTIFLNFSRLLCFFISLVYPCYWNNGGKTLILWISCSFLRGFQSLTTNSYPILIDEDPLKKVINVLSVIVVQRWTIVTSSTIIPFSCVHLTATLGFKLRVSYVGIPAKYLSDHVASAVQRRQNINVFCKNWIVI